MILSYHLLLQLIFFTHKLELSRHCLVVRVVVLVCWLLFLCVCVLCVFVFVLCFVFLFLGALFFVF